MKYGYHTANCTDYDLLKEFVRRNKKNMTEAESVLWTFLRRNQLGVKFRRQYVVGEYIADFICLPHNLIIEIDGKYHNRPDQQILDQERSDQLYSLGFYILRFTNEQIIGDIEHVLNRIKQHITDTKK